MLDQETREIILQIFTSVQARPAILNPAPLPSAPFEEASITLGADLRAIRKARSLTLSALALRTGRSVGWLSQVERDLSSPTYDDITALARALDVPLSRFFGQTPAEDGRIVRSRARRRIGGAEGLTEELLSPDLTDDFEVIHSTFAPGASITTPVTRPTTELGTLTQGRLTITISDARYDLTAGDSFRIKNEPYTWSNPHLEPAAAIWVIAPPVY